MLTRRGWLAGALAAPAALAARPSHAQGSGMKTAPAVVEAAKAEKSLLIYSNLGPDNWSPVVQGFNQLFPWIEVKALNIGASEPIVRYRAEAGSNVATADLVVTGSISDWIQFADDKLAMDYTSAEAPDLPGWSKPFPNIYTFSTDPLVLGYNKLLIPEAKRPSAFADFASTVKANPALFRGKVGSYALDGFGGSIYWAYIRTHGEAGWQALEALGTSVRLGDGTGQMMDKLSRGEDTACYFMSGPLLFPKMLGNLGRLIDWKFISDGTPIFLRGMAATKASRNPNAAKLLLDYILSRQGQLKVAEGGLTPYRDDVAQADVKFYSLKGIAEKVGQDKLILIDYDRRMIADHEAFAQRWAKAMGQP